MERATTCREWPESGLYTRERLTRRQEIQFAGFQPSQDLNKHKFLLDIDGNGWR